MIKHVSTLVLGLILLSSCEKETYVDYYIHNQSSSVITVEGSNIIHSTHIDQTIIPDEKKDISSWKKFGKETGLFEPTSMFGNDLVITNASGDTLTKDYRSLSNWTSDVENARAVASHEYVLIVTDSDF